MTRKTVKEGELTARIQHRLIEEIAERKQAEDNLSLKQTQLQSLLEASQSINATLDQTAIRKALVNAAAGLLHTQFGTAGIVEDGRMVFREYRREGQWSPVDYTFEPGYGVPGHVMQTLKPYRTNDAEHDSYVIQDIRQALDFHQLIDVPILNRSGELLGCFEIHDPEDGRPFVEDDIKLLEGLAASAAIALENTQLLAEREQQALTIRQSSERIRFLSEAGARHAGMDYFRQLVQAAAKALQVKIVFVAELTGESMNEAHSLAVWVGNDFSENFSWSLAGTPCEHIPEGRQVHFEANVQKEYPDDAWLREVGAESYFAIPLKAYDGRVAGHMGILDDKPLPDHEDVAAILKIFAGRAGMERERMQMEEALRESEASYRLTMEKNVEGIVVLDMNGCVLYCNPAATALLEKKEEELLGQPFGLPVTDIEAGMEISTKDRGVRQVDMRAAPGHWQGRDARIIWLHDRTEQLRATEALAESHARLRISLEGTIHAIALVVEGRDPYTAGHQRRVAKLAVAIARTMGVEEEKIEGIHWGCMIHDIGKIYLPAEILSKPSPLTDLEYSLVQTHPQVGYDILKDVEFPWPVADIVHQHHERIDGSGYPRGLKGDQICLEARITVVADVTEAMSNHRPYQPGLGIDKALAEIKRGRGKQYDADVVDACLKLFKEATFSFE